MTPCSASSPVLEKLGVILPLICLPSFHLPRVKIYARPCSLALGRMHIHIYLFHSSISSCPPLSIWGWFVKDLPSPPTGTNTAHSLSSSSPVFLGILRHKHALLFNESLMT